MPSSISTFELSPKNLARCATTSLAIMSKSRIFLARRPERTSFNPSQNCFRWSPVNSSGEPREERTASSRGSKLAEGLTKKSRVRSGRAGFGLPTHREAQYL